MNFRTLLNKFISNPWFNFIKPEFLRLWNDRMCVDDAYHKVFGKRINWEHPTTYNEKMQIYKLKSSTENLSEYVDKHLVRNYIQNKIGAEHLIRQYGCWEDPNQINLETLPKSFVIKPTHGSGWISFIKDKDKVNWHEEIKKMKYWLTLNWYEITKERIYKNIKPRIIIEESLTDIESNVPCDHKIFIFDHKIAFLYVDTDRYGDHRRNVYDVNWKLQPFTIRFENTAKPLEKPNKLNEMLQLALTIGEDFKNVRVDFYIVDDTIYFSELTFTQGSGLQKIMPEKYDTYVGDMFNIS